VNLVESYVMILVAAVVCMAHLVSREQWVEVDESVSLVAWDASPSVAAVGSFGSSGESALG
jgi:hypothetical protein